MKIIYLGTPEFSIAPLKELASAGHTIAAVITQPDKPFGRKAVLTPPPLKTYAQSKGYKIFQFEKIRDNVAELKSLNADIMVTCAYGQILTKDVISACPYGVINIHASVLPKYRGASPVEHAIINGESETGVTIMQTDEGLDTGDIILIKKIEIMPDQTAGELLERLSALGAVAITEALLLIESGRAMPVKQDGSLATKVKTIKKEDAAIDFTKSAYQIKNFIRGMNPRPVAFTFYKDMRIKIFSAALCEKTFDSVECGKILLADEKQGLLVGTRQGVLEILTLQAAGGSKMTAKEFLKGKKLAVGSFFKDNIE